MPLVTFKEDVFPYVRGDVVDLTPEEKARVDIIVKGRNYEAAAYVSGNKRDQVVTEVDDPGNARKQLAELDRAASQQNNIDQAAQLEAQRTAVAEPANVDALGLAQETPAQVVTGTQPVADVEVSNPQEATDLGSGEGADVKVKRSKK